MAGLLREEAMIGPVDCRAIAVKAVGRSSARRSTAVLALSVARTAMAVDSIVLKPFVARFSVARSADYSAEPGGRSRG